MIIVSADDLTDVLEHVNVSSVIKNPTGRLRRNAATSWPPREERVIYTF